MPRCRYLLEMTIAPGDARSHTRSVLPNLLAKPRARRACLPPGQPHHCSAMGEVMAGGNGGHYLPCLNVSSASQGIPVLKVTMVLPATHSMHLTNRKHTAEEAALYGPVVLSPNLIQPAACKHMADSAVKTVYSSACCSFLMARVCLFQEIFFPPCLNNEGF